MDLLTVKTTRIAIPNVEWVPFVFRPPCPRKFLLSKVLMSLRARVRDGRPRASQALTDSCRPSEFLMYIQNLKEIYLTHAGGGPGR